MKIVASYRDCGQCGVEEWENYTVIIHLKETDTLKDAYEKIKKTYHFPEKITHISVALDIQQEVESGE